MDYGKKNRNKSNRINSSLNDIESLNGYNLLDDNVTISNDEDEDCEVNDETSNFHNSVFNTAQKAKDDKRPNVIINKYPERNNTKYKRIKLQSYLSIADTLSGHMVIADTFLRPGRIPIFSIL